MSSNLLVRFQPVQRSYYFHPMVTLKQSALTLNYRTPCLSLNRCATSNTVQKDEPVKYTSSKAHTFWKAAYNWRDPNFYDHTPRSQRRVVILSTAAVLIYFCFLREENDIDEIIYQPLVKTAPFVEEPLLEASIAEHKRFGKKTTELEERLKEIKDRKQ